MTVSETLKKLLIIMNVTGTSISTFVLMDFIKLNQIPQASLVFMLGLMCMFNTWNLKYGIWRNL
jgi:hypothetical protein